MPNYDDERDIFSNSNPNDEWRVESLLEDDTELFSSSDHMIHNDIIDSSDDVQSAHVTKQSEKGSKKGKKKKRSTGRIVATTLLSLFLVAVISVGLVAAAVVVYISSVDPDVDFDLNSLNLAYTSIVYAQDPETGEIIEVSSLHGQENRIWRDYSEFSPYLTDAIVSIEDKRFYEHEGVDWKRTFGAFVNTFVDIYGGTQGGSTITQQLVKNLTGDDEQTASRKIQEILRARQLESEYDNKALILECYANTVHFGNGCDGIETASNFYFGKEAGELTLRECASLAATIQSPSVINPLDGPERNEERTETCLSIMLEEGYITQEEYDDAMDEELKVVGSLDNDSPKDEQESNVNSYFIDTLIDDIIDDLMAEYDYTYAQAENKIYTGGLRIYSTLNPMVQSALEETYENQENFPYTEDGGYAQSAQTIMDYNGHIVAIAGGVGEKQEDRSLNRAYQTTRQPGSSIKPLSVYAPGIEYNKLTYSSMIHDFHVLLANGSYYPKAAGSGKMVTTEYAIQRSLNSTAVQVCNSLSPTRCFNFLQDKFKITTLVESEVAEDGTVITDNALAPLALGGMAHGVTVTEMTAAYATFGNLGKYYEPTTYYAVYDTFDNLLLQQQDQGTQAITPDTANIMNQLMQKVVSGGTGGAASLYGWPVFGKTGTTDNKHDCWFAGGTPYFVSVVWCGYDSDHDLPSGANPAPSIWKLTMNRVMNELEKCDFNRSTSVVAYEYCTDSGYIATTGCPKTAVGYYKKGVTSVDGVACCQLHEGTMVAETKLGNPVGGKYANIKQAEIPEADAWKNGEDGVNRPIEDRTESTE